MGYGCSITFDLLINMSYTHENKKIRASVYQAPEKKIRLPHWSQYEKKVLLDNGFPCSYKDNDPTVRRGICQIKIGKYLTEKESHWFHHT